MKVFYSGGSAIPEVNIDDSNIMLSFFVNISPKSGKPDSRLKKIMKIRKKLKRKGK